MEHLSAYKEEFSILGTAGVLKAVREKGLEEFLSAGFPTPKTEDWRYADLKLLRKAHLKRAQDKTSNKKISPLTGWPQIIIENGQIILTPKALVGVEILTTPESVEGYQNKGLFDSPLERMNLAFAETCLVIKIKKRTEVPGLEIVFLNTSERDEALYLRNLILVEEGAKANLFIRTLGTTGGTWTNQITNIYLGKNSELALIRDFEAADDALITARDYAAVKAGAIFRASSLMAGLPSIRYEIETELLGGTAHTEFSGGLLAGHGETIDVLTRVHHVKGNTTSNQTFKGVAGAKGKTAFQGRVRVEQDAQKIEAHQNCHNLILERTGEANVKPELLIFADDVVCSHGATVGEIDEDALFYMKQRGIPENQARGLLVQAFLGEFLEGLNDEKILAHFTAKIEAWMAGNLK